MYNETWKMVTNHPILVLVADDLYICPTEIESIQGTPGGCNINMKNKKVHNVNLTLIEVINKINKIINKDES